MGLQSCLEELRRQATWERPRSLNSLVAARWVRQALERAGAQTIRRRKLPSEAVVWLVIGMALFRDNSIDAVVKHLGLSRAHGAAAGSASGGPVSSAGVARARTRVGPEPLRELFELSSNSWQQELAEQNQWQGLSLLAIDGSTLRVADSQANEETFGRPGSSRSKCAYPQMRLVALLAVGSRVLVDFRAGSYREGEQSLARPMVESLPDRSLLILDRGFVNYPMFAQIAHHGSERHFLCRAKKNLGGKTLRTLGENDWLIEIAMPAARLREDPTLPETIVVRMIEYCVAGFRPSRLMTSLVDAENIPASEIVDLYHKRWEIEIAYDEIKTHTLERRETLRSRSPKLVWQEVYGLAIAYNLLRVMMARAAVQAGVEPARISYRNSLLEVRNFFLIAAAVAPGNLPALYRKLCDAMTHLVLPARRSRRYPRAVKTKMSNYKRKDF